MSEDMLRVLSVIGPVAAIATVIMLVSYVSRTRLTVGEGDAEPSASVEGRPVDIDTLIATKGVNWGVNNGFRDGRGTADLALLRKAGRRKSDAYLEAQENCRRAELR